MRDASGGLRVHQQAHARAELRTAGRKRKGSNGGDMTGGRKPGDRSKGGADRRV